MNLLHIFIKNPRLGYVKTRLAATVGNEAALAIYHQLLDKTREAALAANSARWLWYSDHLQAEDAWSAADFSKKIQKSGDLGERMAHAFEQGFQGGATKALIIGSDCPELSGEILDAAFAALDTHDCCIGPTPDGGYYLLGMNRFFLELFTEIVWSTESVFPTTMARMDSLGLQCGQLPILSDVDNQSDWESYQNRQP
jgi:uncharacterized protein